MNLHNICQQFKLGNLQQHKSIDAGLMHQSYYVSTSQGQFIIKQLNKSLMQYRDFAATEAIAKQFAAQGLPARYALAYDSDVAIYRFIEGSALATQQLHPTQIATIAQTSATMHNLNLQIDIAPTFSPFKTTAAEWNEFASTTSLLDNKRLQQFVDLQQRYDQSFTQLCKRTVVSHRDFTPANLLWAKGEKLHRQMDECYMTNLTIIDWELAGYINPDLEVLHNAIDVALGDDAISTSALFHYICSYQAQRHLLESPQDIINGCLGSWIHWILFCLKRQHQLVKPLNTTKHIKKALMVIDFIEEQREKLAAALAN